MGEFVDGLECPRCGNQRDEFMDRPALKRAGWNPRSGRLYECRVCMTRVTEFEIETGDDLSALVDGAEFTPERWRD